MRAFRLPLGPLKWLSRATDRLTEEVTHTMPEPQNRKSHTPQTMDKTIVDKGRRVELLDFLANFDLKIVRSPGFPNNHLHNIIIYMRL